MSQTSLLLTSDVGLGDTPLWRGESNHAPEIDHLYCLGANFLFWQKSERDLYSPKIVFPVDFGLQATNYQDLQVPDPGLLLFLPGKTLDVMLRRSNNVSNKMQGYIIKNGAVDRTVEYIFSHELGVQLYGDKYLVVLTNISLELININYPSSIGGCSSNHRITQGIPPDGSLAISGDTAVIWSRQNSQRVVVNLDTMTVNYPINIDRLEPDERIKAVSVDSLVTCSSNCVRFYDSRGRRILDLDTRGRYTFSGVLDSCCSRNLAISFFDAFSTQRSVYWMENGKLQNKNVGSINTRALILYRDQVFGMYGGLQLVEVNRLPTFTGNPKQVVTSDYGEFRVHRYIKVSSGGNWICEISKEGEKHYSLVIRPVFGSLLAPVINTKKHILKDGPIVTGLDVIPAFMYESSGIIRIWACELMEMKNETSIELAQPKTYTMNLHTWDKIRDTLENTDFSYELFDLPTEKFHARWFKTDEWVILTLGSLAYVFTHEGAKAREHPLKLPEMHLHAHGPISILCVRGFDKSLWFLAGYMSKGIPLIWECAVWNGADNMFIKEFTEPIYMANAVATGIRNEKQSGRRLPTMELIISSATTDNNWYHIAYSPNMNQPLGTNFCDFVGNEDRKILCENPDADGNVYFSVGRCVYIYKPKLGSSSEKFSTMLNVNIDESNLFRPTDDSIHALQVGFRKFWVATPGRFYLLDTNGLQKTGIKENMLATRPLLSFDLSTWRTQFQVPGRIMTYPAVVDKRDLEAIFENDKYMWLSTQPMSLYVRPLLLDPRNHPYGVFLDNGRMLVVVTYIEELVQQLETKEQTEFESVIGTHQDKKIKYVIYEVLI